jgi:hypothetical protein
MQGPFAKPEAFCQSPYRQDRGPCPYPDSGDHAKGVVPPYSDVLWFRTGENNCHLAFKLAQGWFVDAKGDECLNDVESECQAVDLGIKDLVPGGSPEVVFRSETQVNDLVTNDEGYVKSYAKACDTRMIVCGVPTKGTPSCLYLPTGRRRYCSATGPDDWTWQLEPLFSPDGQVEVKATGSPDGDARLFVGRRPLAFP